MVPLCFLALPPVDCHPWSLIVTGVVSGIYGSPRVVLFIPGSRFFVLSKTSACENLDSGDVRIEVTQS